ncbi:MAG: type VI secretion system ATPase TssH [Planctomycetes bacterium]|nr:type VI secretion system ATPase TssH [Planctomycetota bacterium]
MKTNLKSLIGKLTESSRRSLQSAAGMCNSRTNYEVEPEHWLHSLCEQKGGDVQRILAQCRIPVDAVTRELEHALGAFKTGNGKIPAFSPDIEDMVRDAWLYASLELGSARIRSGALFLAALSDTRIGRRLRDACKSLAGIKVDELANALPAIVKASPETAEAVQAGDADFAGGGEAGEGADSGRGTPALDQFTTNLTELARQDKLDPVLGRDAEIRQIVDILTRKRQNNPILTGEAGVGKTAVVEGFAHRIAQGDVPEALRNVELHSLDLGLLQAGAGVKGEFENRLKQVIQEVKSSSKPIILFIDEAHTLIGAGGAEGQNDAANLLKPALARGELRTVAATTWAEYKKYFEKDAALTRRFQVVKVDEPAEGNAIAMMRGVAGMLERHHKVGIRDEAIVDSVRLSSRYMPARQLPDKSVSVLDTACARIAIGQGSTPAALEDSQRRMQVLETELKYLREEEALGHDHRKRIEEAEAAHAEAKARAEELGKRWDAEKELVAEVVMLQSELRAGVADDRQKQQKQQRLVELRAQLQRLQGETPLVHAEVTAQTVAEVVSAWTGIPVGKMVADQIQAVLQLAKRLSGRVLGQDHALEAIARRIQTSRAKLDNPSRPVGVFLLVGPSGVGKTETALALADALYGGERNLITINMSEYQEAHTVSSLKGSPPGYVGYGEGGVLTEAVRRRPYSVVLLDEVEKAHPDVMELFFQVFDKGMLEDGEGREIDFKNTVILLTSNVGTDKVMRLCADPELVPTAEALAEALRPELLKVFPPALLGRMVTIGYYPILPAVLEQIVRLQVRRIQDRMRQNHGVELQVDDALVANIVERCKDPDSGARAVDRILTQGLLPMLSTEILGLMAQGKQMTGAKVGVAGNGEFEIAVS